MKITRSSCARNSVPSPTSSPAPLSNQTHGFFHAQNLPWLPIAQVKSRALSLTFKPLLHPDPMCLSCLVCHHQATSAPHPTCTLPPSSSLAVPASWNALPLFYLLSKFYSSFKQVHVPSSRKPFLIPQVDLISSSMCFEYHVCSLNTALVTWSGRGDTLTQCTRAHTHTRTQCAPLKPRLQVASSAPGRPSTVSGTQ